jgi:hypothetical protein
MGDIHLPGVAKKKGVYKRHKSRRPVEIVRTTAAALSLS